MGQIKGGILNEQSKLSCMSLIALFEGKSGIMKMVHLWEDFVSLHLVLYSM